MYVFYELNTLSSVIIYHMKLTEGSSTRKYNSIQLALALKHNLFMEQEGKNTSPCSLYIFSRCKLFFPTNQINAIKVLIFLSSTPKRIFNKEKYF